MSDTVEQNAPRSVETQEPFDMPTRVPEFATEHEAREFWATHEFAPYFDQTEDVTNSPPSELALGPGRAGSTARKRPPEGRMDLVSIRLPVEMVEAVKEIAAERHLPYQTLMRSWIGERVAKERRAIRRNHASSQPVETRS